MREHPIIFSTPMVQAILDGNKTQTRRVIKPQPNNEYGIVYTTIEGFQCAPPGEQIWGETEEGESFQIKPKYEKGDLLWVKETWSTMPYGQCSDGSVNLEYAYKADGSLGNFPEITIAKNLDKWKPSIHMPREAARLFLEVKSVRVERLKNITQDDLRKEGVMKMFEKADMSELCIWRDCVSAIERINKKVFSRYWDSLNAKRGYSWESNPWVFVYKFIRVEK